MPRFGSFFNKINEKLEEAKISDLNHELGKFVQGSHVYLGSFKSDALNVGTKLKTESKRLWRTGGFSSTSTRTPSGLPKSVSLPVFPSGGKRDSSATVSTNHYKSGVKDSGTRAYKGKTSFNPGGGNIRSKYLYKSSKESGCQFFDDVDEAILRGKLTESEENDLLTKSEIVERFIKVVENGDNSCFGGSQQVETNNSTKQTFGEKNNQRKHSSREEIRRKLASGFNNEATFSNSMHDNNSKKQGSQRRGGDLEVCFINETIVEEEQLEEDEIEPESSNKLNLLEHEIYDDYHYEEDYWDHIKLKESSNHNQNPSANGLNKESLGIRRSHTNWEAFKTDKDSETSESNSSETANGESNNSNSIGHLQSEATLALANCHKIAKRKLLLQKEEDLEKEENLLARLIGKSVSEKLLTEGKFKQQALLNLNTATVQVIVNDFHCKIEKLNEELVNLVIEKDELQIEQDSQLLDLHDFQSSLSTSNSRA